MKLTENQQAIAIKNYNNKNRYLIKMIEDGDFETDLKRPVKNTIKKCDHCGSCYKDKNSEINFNNAMKAYRDDQLLKREQFKFTCMYDYDLDYNSNISEKIFQMAWDREHSSGLHEVYYEMEELVELLNMKDNNER